MLKFFETDGSCHILLEPPLVLENTQNLSMLLKRDYASWHIEFGHLYNVSAEIIQLLYEALFIRESRLTITTHKSRLSRYFKRVGLEARFESLVHEDVVKLSEIEVILIGGSADSSAKIKEIVKNITLKKSTLVIVQHVESSKSGYFDEILQRVTEYRVSYARDAQKIEKGAIYIAPNDKHLFVENGYFSLNDEKKYNYSKPSISLSYESFSHFYKEKLLVIQECGYASDGVDKMELVKQNSSKLIIQNIDECEAKPMIRNALNLGLQDYTFSLKEIIQYLNIIDNTTTKEAWIEYLLEQIHERYGYDFKLYHRDMVERRLDIFMLKHDIKNIKDAVGVILFKRTVFKVFFLDVSINVTEFFRNPSSFKEISKLLKKSHKHSHTLKLWSAGCSSGEEVYSLSILLDSLGLLGKSLIYATDFNSVVLNEAKNGLYSSESYEEAEINFAQTGIETELGKYITTNKHFININENIKSKILFFQHNLIEDSSFNEFDIIICKNVIIYFNDNLQKKVFDLFYNSLKFGGYLVLGESEMIIPSYLDKFECYSESNKIFKKVA